MSTPHATYYKSLRSFANAKLVKNNRRIKAVVLRRTQAISGPETMLLVRIKIHQSDSRSKHLSRAVCVPQRSTQSPAVLSRRLTEVTGCCLHAVGAEFQRFELPPPPRGKGHGRLEPQLSDRRKGIRYTKKRLDSLREDSADHPSEIRVNRGMAWQGRQAGQKRGHHGDIATSSSLEHVSSLCKGAATSRTAISLFFVLNPGQTFSRKPRVPNTNCYKKARMGPCRLSFESGGAFVCTKILA